MEAVLIAVAAAAILFVGIALFQRVAPHQLVRAYYWRFVNPLFRLLAGRVPGLVLLETTGRRTGNNHEVPVAGRLDGSVVWIVAGHAARADYVHNIKANPRVRVRVGGRWREGTAALDLDDDPRRRALQVNPINGSFIRMATSDLVSVRVDLD
ncbi:MAG: nitroreductase family deazaflavin-dependent oxidoreductase [Actinomycetota bacterium]|nr:nitroreductase family deazaflavin-dependent oxidoreductase [Actinomycetota bacterium]